MYISCPSFSTGIKTSNWLNVQEKQSVFCACVVLFIYLFGERENTALQLSAVYVAQGGVYFTAWLRSSFGADEILDAVTKAQWD